MPNGRCRFHGGPSTGPRTPEGLERSRKARWKHGRYSAKSIEDRRELRALLRHVRASCWAGHDCKMAATNSIVPEGLRNGVNNDHASRHWLF